MLLPLSDFWVCTICCRPAESVLVPSRTYKAGQGLERGTCCRCFRAGEPGRVGLAESGWEDGEKGAEPPKAAEKKNLGALSLARRTLV